MLTIIDEFTRECLAIDVARKLNHDDVLERLAWLMVRVTCLGTSAHITAASTVKAARDWFNRVDFQT